MSSEIPHDRRNEVKEAPEAPVVRHGQLTRPDGRTLAWVEAGILDGVPILRVPGTPGSRLQVRPDQSPWLDRGLRMILTERPGFGASTRHPGRGFLDHADDLAAILDELGLESIPIMGGSGAGPYLLALAARHPDRVRAVTVAVGAAPIVDEEADLMIGLNAQGYRLARDGDRDGMTELLTPVRESMLADPLASFREVMSTAPPSDQETMRDPAWQDYLVIGLTEALRPGVEGWVDESMLMFSGWFDLDVSAVRASLTWWHGDNDRNAPLPAVRRLLRQIPHARLIVWPDAGHLTPYHQEGAILDELLART
jgi:pimeloyl-ACP methyl ester carboxylesterase